MVGIDEVGRGPWAGPVVSAAVAVKGELLIPGIKDSKLLGFNRRVEIARQIRLQAAGIGVGWCGPAELDQVGLAQAVRLSMLRAINQLNCQVGQIVIDGNINYLENTHDSVAIIKADNKFPCVSAASIVAKVARDLYMQRIAAIYPYWGFDSNVGYGTLFHRQQLQRYGACDIHRKSFAPVAKQLATVV
jgi:ribonuclease HII